jgi:hypothetical protein
MHFCKTSARTQASQIKDYIHLLACAYAFLLDVCVHASIANQSLYPPARLHICIFVGRLRARKHHLKASLAHKHYLKASLVLLFVLHVNCAHASIAQSMPVSFFLSPACQT